MPIFKTKFQPLLSHSASSPGQNPAAAAQMAAQAAADYASWLCRPLAAAAAAGMPQASAAAAAAGAGYLPLPANLLAARLSK